KKSGRFLAKDNNNEYNKKIFFNYYNSTTFGLSHFYDIFNNSIENFLRNKDFYFSLDGKIYAVIFYL
uniref:hypothetical protein n=1 Tax=uncultured Brachyspira sp. TaxID=221953 RepID=UPI0027DE843F